MVGPTSPDRRTVLWLKAGFVLLVAASAGLVSLQADAEPSTVLAALGGGTVVGVLLVWIAFPSADTTEVSRRRSR